jgi:hypothetical protein
MIVSRHPDTAWQKVEDNIVVVTPKTRQIHILSGCATDIWDMIASPQPFSALRDQILEHFEVTANTAEKDLQQILKELTKKELIQTQDA